MNRFEAVTVLEEVAVKHSSPVYRRYFQWCAESLKVEIEVSMPPDYCFSCLEWDNPSNQEGLQICIHCGDGDKRIPDE